MHDILNRCSAHLENCVFIGEGIIELVGFEPTHHGTRDDYQPNNISHPNEIDGYYI